MAWLRQLVDWQRETEDPAEFLDSLRFDLAERRGLRLHPARRGHRAARTAPPRWTSPTRSTPRSATARSAPGSTAAWSPLESTLDNGDTVEIFTSKAPEAGPEPGLAELRQSRPGPQQDPPVVLQGAPRGRRRGGQGPDRPGHAQAGPPAAAADVRRDRSRRSPRDLRYADLSGLYAAVGEGRISAQSVVEKLVRAVGGTGRRAGGPGRGHPDPAQGARRPPGQLRERLRASRSRARRRLGPPVQVLHPGARRRDPGLRHPRPRRLRAPRGLREPRAPERHPARADGRGPLGPDRRLGLPGRDPGRGAGPDPAALRRHQGAVRPARQHPVARRVHTTRDRVAVSRFTFEMGDPKHLGHVLRAVRNIDGVYDVYRVTN